MSNPALRARHVRAAACALLTLLIGGLVVAPPARAQDDGVRLELVAQPLVHGQNDPFGIKVRIVNDSDVTLEGLTLNVNLLFRRTSRFALAQSYEEEATFGASDNKTLGFSVEPGTTATATLNTPVSDLVPQTGSTAEGVYPLVVSLLDSEFQAIDSFVTPVMYYPNRVESPLNLALVIPLNDVPSRGPDGDFDFAGVPEGRVSLEEALGEDGWLSTTLAMLQKFGGRRLRAGVAPTPRLVEEIAAMRSGYQTTEEQVDESANEAEAARTALTSLSDTLATEGIQPLLTPYAYPDLPLLAQSQPSDIGLQINEGEEVLSSLLGVEADREWLVPPSGRIDENTVGALEPGTADHSFFTERSLANSLDPLASGCSEPSLTFTCPIEVDTPQGSIEGYVADSTLQELTSALARPGDDRLDLQRLLAETAMIREEQPGLAGRVVQLTLPELWYPSRRTVRQLYGGLARAPWLKTITPLEGLELGIEPTGRQMVPPDATKAGLEIDEPTLGEIESAIESASDRVTDFSQIQPPDPLVQRLRRNLLVAESRAWWTDPASATRGVEYAAETVDEIERILDRIRIEVSESITLTSRSEEIPMRVINDTGFPVRLTLDFDSPRLTATAPDTPQIFDDDVTAVTVGVESESSGISILTVQLLMPRCFGDDCVVDDRTPTIRSTDFNNVALTITVGALLFLVAFYVARWVRRRGTAPGRGAA